MIYMRKQAISVPVLTPLGLLSKYYLLWLLLLSLRIIMIIKINTGGLIDSAWFIYLPHVFPSHASLTISFGNTIFLTASVFWKCLPCLPMSTFSLEPGPLSSPSQLAESASLCSCSLPIPLCLGVLVTVEAGLPHYLLSSSLDQLI